MPVVPFALALFFAFSGQNPASQPECQAWSACREAALAAEADQDFERFHDLAWRAVQKGPRNNPELMLMLARAQSSSGRPLDALVMLRRVAEMGVAADASSDGFARVRALRGWEEVERRLASGSRNVAPLPASAPPAEPAAVPAKAEVASGPADGRGPEREPAALAPVAAVAETLRFATPAFIPAGLAYDAVSRRFIVGDRQARKLTVVDEFSHQIANLAGAQATGFGEIAALEIDPREGNLWVVTADGTGSSGTTTLHKLQLISARTLQAFTPAAEAGAARLTDVAITPQGTVLAVDEAGRRVFRLRAGARTLEVAASLEDVRPISVAPGPDGVIYVTHEEGIRRVDLATRKVSEVAAAIDTSISGIARIRWHRRALIGIQRTPAGGHRAVRLRLSRDGRRVTKIEVLDPSVDAASPAATCISGDGLYYLAAGAGGEMIVRRVELD